MQYLKSTKIEGEAEQVSDICRLFGDVYFGGPIGPEIALRISKVLPNVYRSSRPEEQGALLFIVVPVNEDIENVWVDHLAGIDNVKLGTANVGKSLKVKALAITKGLMTLYLCLHPSGALIMETGALGI